MFRQTNQAEISHAYLQLDEAIHLVAWELPRREEIGFSALRNSVIGGSLTGTRPALVNSETRELQRGRRSGPLSMAELVIP